MSTFLNNVMTGDNLPNGNYLPLDLNLINNPLYADLTIEAMVLHSLYTMRMTCSIYNSQKDGSWLDEEGIPFIYFANEEAAKLLRVSERKITTLRNSLATQGLIKVVRHGLKNYRIYVANPEKPHADIRVALTFKNYTTTKEKRIQPVEKDQTGSPAFSTDAKSAASNTQKLPTSTQQPLVQPNTNTTSVTPDTSDTLKTPDKNPALIAGLKARYAHLLPETVFLRFMPFCQGDYHKAKWYVDTLFKAKFVSNQQFIQAGLPAESEALTFEQNPYLKAGLADAVAKALEQIYRYGSDKINKPEAFFFAFLKGYFTEKTRQYLVDFYEMTPTLQQTLVIVQQNNSKKAYKIRTKKKKIS